MSKIVMKKYDSIRSQNPQLCYLYIRWAKYGALPAPHQQVFAIVHAITHGAVTSKAFLPLFQLFQQPKISRN